ncbi:hypothetical protein B0H21DRAFT_42983 [Amylocystis lapponica]|nr:hypothetical protein B0H21DRAFT_42983 [Amylocystis lapponica]
MGRRNKNWVVTPQRSILFQHYSHLNDKSLREYRYSRRWDHTLPTRRVEPPLPKTHSRRSRGKDAGYYNSVRFICAAAVDGDNDSEVDGDVPHRGKQHGVRAHDARDDIGLVAEPAYAPPALHEISLLDLAKPTKRRTRRREFETVGTISQVVTFEVEDGWSIMEGEDGDWVFVEQDAQPRRTYSSVLRDDPAST